MHVTIGTIGVKWRRLVHQQFLFLSELLLWFDGEFSQSEMHFSDYTNATWMRFKCDVPTQDAKLWRHNSMMM